VAPTSVAFANGFAFVTDDNGVFSCTLLAGGGFDVCGVAQAISTPPLAGPSNIAIRGNRAYVVNGGGVVVVCTVRWRRGRGGRERDRRWG
jgi:hypothetical protein